MTDAKKVAGGRATEAGMGFQAAVAAWFAAYLLSDIPIGTQFGLPSSLRIIGLQCETGDPVDDVVVQLEGGGTIYLQCKTRPSLENSPDSALGKTVKQLVGLYCDRGRLALESRPVAVVLAIAWDAPRSVDKLEEACRLFDHGGSWSAVVSQSPEDKRSALILFESLAREAWASLSAEPFGEEDLVALGRLFHIHRFGEQEKHPDWREAARLLGRRLYGGDDAGEAPMTTLMAMSRKFIRTGAPVDRGGLLRALRAEGHIDLSSPAFDKDISTLLAYSLDERERLRKHTRLPLDGGIPIQRESLDPLLAVVEGGSLLVTGEPGAGKTGILLALADRISSVPRPVVFLSVERFSGYTKRSDFRTDLNLEHDPIDVLAAWPGTDPGILIIDALDASRGGPSEQIVATFIANAVEKIGARWSVVASIRSFDLRNGQRFREIMPGSPPNLEFVEASMDKVRHFRVPRLSSKELEDVSAASPKLRAMVATAPAKLHDLLRNIFNLSLSAELLDAGVEAQSIRTVSTQSELITRYEDIRLPSQQLRRAVKATVTLMVGRRQLAVRAVDIENDAVDDVRNAGVLVAAGDRVAFAHHVLFDHIAGRFYLKWDDTGALRDQISSDPSIGLLLGPALRFAMERIWQADVSGRASTWQFLVDLAAMPKPDPVVVSIAVRTATERVELPADVDGLCSLIQTTTDIEPVGRLLSRLARFVKMALDELGGVNDPTALAWARVALVATSSTNVYLFDAAQVLLRTLAEKTSLDDPQVLSAFGEAARNLLRMAWSDGSENPMRATIGIQLVSKSFGSDPKASRALLERILADRFTEHASQEAPSLAENIQSIMPHDADFVVRIYRALFTLDVTDEGRTWIGGAASRILPLTSTNRQDYEHARWHLVKALKSILAIDPIVGTAAVIGAVRGLDKDKRRSREIPREPTILNIDGAEVRIVDDSLSLEDWRTKDVREEKPLAVFVEFLKTCSESAFRDAVNMTRIAESNAAIWARILGIAAERPRVVDDLLWPLVKTPHFLALEGLARDAVIYLGATYESRTPESRVEFEDAMLASDVFPDGREARWWRSVLGRFLSTVPKELLATPGMKALRAEMEAAGDLTGNRPYMTMSFGWGSDENIVDSMLQRSGADLERSPDREIRAASRKIEDLIKHGAKDLDVGALGGLWRDIVDLVALLDAGVPESPHAELVHSSWGAACNGVERLAESALYSPGANDLPDLEELLALIDRLSSSRYPEVVDNHSDHMGWGNWDVRVYAATSLVALAQRFAEEREDIVDRMQKCLHDPAPTVRLQIVRALNILADLPQDRMWLLISEVVDNEAHEGIRASLIAGPLQRLAYKFPARCSQLLTQLLEKEWKEATGEESSDRDRDAEASSGLATYLYVARDQHEAWVWIERWLGNIRRGRAYLLPMLHDLRHVFFFPYADKPKPDQLEMARRARTLLDAFVASAAAALLKARPHLLGEPDAETVTAWRPLYTTADQMIDRVCNHLYFGSGAFRSNGGDNEIGLESADAKRRFLADYSGILDAIATHAQARTFHNLFELLEYLVEGDPTSVFDRISKILLGPAAADGYHRESLGMTGLVKLIRRYLADHRDVFEDSDRRRKLIEVLELFSSVGWPDALQLLFELPELLR